MTLHRTSRRWAIADLAEAAAGAEKADIARPLLAEAEEQAERLGIDSFLVHRAHALLADSVAESEDRFRAALGAAERTAPNWKVPVLICSTVSGCDVDAGSWTHACTFRPL